MIYSKWFLALPLILLIGCSPKANDGVTPTQPSYTNTGYPNPLVLYNGYLATGVTPNVYEYSPTGLTDAVGTVTLADTTVVSQMGSANLMFVVTSYKDTTWVGFPLLSSGAIDLTTGHYSALTLYVKTTGAGTISFDALGETARVTMAAPSTWQAVTVPITGAMTGPAATELFVANFYSNVISAPVTAYFDQIQFQ